MCNVSENLILKVKVKRKRMLSFDQILNISWGFNINKKFIKNPCNIRV